MKNYKFLLSILAAGALCMFNYSASADDSGKVGYVGVYSIMGHGTYSSDGGHTWAPLVVGKALGAGDVVRTEPGSMIDLLIGKSLADKNVASLTMPPGKTPAPNVVPQTEHNMIRLRPGSTLAIDKLTVDQNDVDAISDCQLDLKKGKLFASIRKVSPSSEYFIKIPNGVAAVRGTQITLDTDGSNEGTSCGVVSGTVWLEFSLTKPDGSPVTNPDGSALAPIAITLSPGQSFSITPVLVSLLIASVQNAANATPQGNNGNVNVQQANTTQNSLLALTLVAQATANTSTMTPVQLATVQTVIAALISPGNTTVAVTIVITTSTSTTPPYIPPTTTDTTTP
jgi:hypothetical protein